MPSLPILLLAFAQAPTPQETVVTAPRARPTHTSPDADVVVVTSEDLRRTGERSLPRAIEKAAPGAVWMQETNLGGGSPILRGLIGPHVLVVIDGVRLNDSTTRLGPNQSLNTIDPAIIDRVEVVKGPASVLYGSDAVGGAILLWTKRRSPGSASATGALGSFQAGLDAHYQSAADGGRLSPSLSYASGSDGALAIGSLESWNDVRSGDGEIDFTGYHGNSFFSSWEHAIDPHRTLRAVLRIHRDFDVPRTDRLLTGFGQAQPSNAEFDFKLQDDTGTTLAWTDTEPAAIADVVQARLFLRRYRENRRIRSTGSSTRRIEEDDILGLGLGLDLTKALGESHLLTYGVDLERDEVDSERTNVNVNTGAQTAATPTFAPNSRYAAAGVFVQDEITSFAPFDVTAGVRYSYFDFRFDEFTSGPGGGPERNGDFDALTASLQVARTVADGLRLTGTVAQGFRAPKLGDLARNGAIFGGTELANADLEPEESLTGEIALDYRKGPWRGALALYHTAISDFIGRVLVDAGDPTTAGDETYLRENTGTVAIAGVELSLRRRLGVEESPWWLGGGGTLTRGRQYDDTINPVTGMADFDDVPARRIPPLHGFLSLAYEPVQTSSAVSWAEVRVVAAAEQDQLNPEDLSDPRMDPDGTEGWATLNADLGGPLGGPGLASSWSFGIHNVLDASYRVHGSGIDAPGVSAVAGLSWSF